MPDLTLCPTCGEPGRQVREGDVEPPVTDNGDPSERADLPLHLHEAWAAYQMLEHDEAGNARIWTSGILALDEFGIASRTERQLWLRLWHAANCARAEVAERAREEASSA